MRPICAFTWVSGERRPDLQRQGSASAVRCEADVFHKGRPPGIGMERIHPGLNAKPGHAVGASRDALLEPFTGSVEVAEAHIGRRDLVRAEVTPLRFDFDLTNQSKRFAFLAG